MAQVTVTVPDARAIEVANAVWTLFPPPTVPEGQAQITKAQNAERMLRWQLKCAVLESRRRAALAANEAALAAVEMDFA